MTVQSHPPLTAIDEPLAAIPGVVRIPLPDYRDSRGSFSPVFVRQDLLARGLEADIAQVNLATNPVAGTLRGLHFQAAPFTEVKIVQVVAGAIFDVVVDLRRGSPAFGRAMWVRLESEQREALYLPRGVAHGYQTLAPHTTVLYTVSAPYAASHTRGVLFSDPALDIPWPLRPSIVSERDLALPALNRLEEYPDTGVAL
jgi:dTDP-4-dehydrorhamnose 3,5-epimerase